MKKIIFLFILVFILTGCSAEYNISLYDDVFSESLSVFDNKDTVINGESFSLMVDDFYINNFLLVDYREDPGDQTLEEIKLYNEIYNQNILNQNGQYGIKLDYVYNKKKYIYSSIVFSLFNNLYYNEQTLRASNINNIFNTYPDLKEIIIKFSTDKSISLSNCDEEKDGILYWYINKDNYMDKYVEIDFDTGYSNGEVIDDGYINWNGIKYIIGVVVIIILISIVVIYEKVKKSNE